MPLPHSIRQIDESALIHNMGRIRKLAPHSKILAMVKANAYGHGLIQVALLLEKIGCDALGVACFSEAIKLRDAGIHQKIVVLRGAYTVSEFELAAHLKLDLVIHCTEQLDVYKNYEKNKNKKNNTITLWLKINTGLNRLGFDLNNIDYYINTIKTIHTNIIIMTHFACADEIDNNATQEQIDTLIKLKKIYHYPLSLANSAGILGWNVSHADWVRPGLMLYGVSPFQGKTGLDHDLKPVMTWRSCLIAIRHQKAGDKIGYNGLFTCPHDMTVGIIGVGYGDGYPRHAQNGTPVLVNQNQSVLVGRVSMDMLAVSLDNIPDAKIGDEVILWGEGLPIENVAYQTASNAYELLCNARER